MEQHESVTHFIHRSGWLRAAVLGANDGILSVASILSGMAAGGSSHKAIMLAGLAGAIAGTASMATGEYVSVSSQRDIENADLHREKKELDAHPRRELRELSKIYEERGLTPELATQVAEQLMAENALDAHARDELGITDTLSARPLQAAISSAASFLIGSTLPLAAAAFMPVERLHYAVPAITLGALALLGAAAAKTSGTGMLRPVARVVLWGALSLFITALIGRWAGTTLA